MKYYPIYKTSEEIIQAIGFVSSSPRGWEKSISEYSKRSHKKGDRLHGFTHHDCVDIHYDKVVGKNHQTKSHHPFVRQQMELCAKVDIPTVLSPQVHELVQVGDGLYTSGQPNSPFVALIIRILNSVHG